MPDKKMKTNKKPKRGGGNTTKLAAVNVPSSHLGAAFPSSLRSRLRYTQIGTINAGAAGSYGYTVIRTNSVYDPDQTGVGSQPAGFAALATLYSVYRVIGAKMKFRVANDSGGTVNVSVFQSTSPLAPASYVAASQQAGSQNFLLSDQSGGKNNVTINRKIQPWIVLGVTRNRYLDDDQFSAAVTTNPATAAYFMLYISALTIAGVVQYNLEIEYDVVFSSRVNLA